MAVKESIRRERTEVAEEVCPHCTGGSVFEPTEDPLVDEADECPMCLGTGRKMDRACRLALRNEREIDVHYSGLERMGG